MVASSRFANSEKLSEISHLITRKLMLLIVNDIKKGFKRRLNNDTPPPETVELEGRSCHVVEEPPTEELD